MVESIKKPDWIALQPIEKCFKKNSNQKCLIEQTHEEKLNSAQQIEFIIFISNLTD